MWFQGVDNMPNKYFGNIESWHCKNPHWEYRFWDEYLINEMLQNRYSEYFDRFKSLDKQIKKCDAARYFILHEYGGLYADLDTFCHCPIDSLIDDFNLIDCDLVFAEESQDAHDEHHWKTRLRQLVSEQYGNIHFVGNAIILSKAKTNFWMCFLDACFKISEKSVLESFSTWHLSKFLKNTNTSASYRVLEWENMLSTRFIEGKTYFTHSYDATWFNHAAERPWEG